MENGRPLVDIAFFWDLDLTLTSEYQQLPIFRRYWKPLQRQAFLEGLTLTTPSDALLRFELTPGMLGLKYLERILEDARPGGCLEGLSNAELRKLGQEVAPATGLAQGLRALDMRFDGRARLQHHIITVGLQPMVEGFLEAQGIADLVAGVAAASYNEKDGIIRSIHTSVDPYDKNKWIIGFMKGGHKLLDLEVKESAQRYSYRNAIVIGDGFTDVAKFSFAKLHGATPIGVYTPGSEESFLEKRLLLGRRVDLLAPRDYTPGTPTFEAIANVVERKLTSSCTDDPPMDPETLYLHRKREMHRDIAAVVERHLKRCDACPEFYKRVFIGPDGRRIETDTTPSKAA